MRDLAAPSPEHVVPMLWFLTHPQVLIEPDVPVPRWGLSEVGRARAASLSAAAFLATVTGVWCSTETKAREAALAVVGDRPLVVNELEDLGENDRSATGFLPGAVFERAADSFFAHPEESVRGWERAVDAQRRIVAAVAEVLADARSGPGDVLVVAHGAVGALLLCHLRGVAITRDLDQPGPGGYLFGVPRRAVEQDERVPEVRWRTMESML